MVEALNKKSQKNFNLTNLNINYQRNNIKTINTEKVHKSDANNNENKGIKIEINKDTENDEEKAQNKNEFKKVKYIPDEIEINTTNQETINIYPLFYLILKNIKN